MLQYSSLRKLLSFFLSLLLFTSCSTEKNTEKAEDTTAAPVVTETQETETALTDGLPDTDMDGYSLIFLGYDGTKYWWSKKQIDATELTGEPVNDSIYNRNAAIETRFNAQIQEKPVPQVEVSLKQDVQAGETDYQVAMVNDQQISGCLTAGVLLMWNDMSGCNLDNPWWNADANNVFQVHGKQYAAVGDFNLSEYSKSYLVYFNKDLYGTLNSVSELYETALDGKWTYDTFRTLSEQYTIDLNGDGAYTDADQYGISGFARVMYQQLLTGAGVKYVDIDAEGNPYFAVAGNDNTISIMQKISEDFGKTNTYFQTADSAVYMAMFDAGQIVFVTDTMYDTEYYRSYDINIGMLPSPKWSETQEKYCSITVGGVVSALPKTLSVKMQEYTGMLMEAMAFAGKQDTLAAYKQTVLQGKYATDEESSDMIDIIFGSQTYDLGVTVWDVRGQYMSNIFEKNSTDVVSVTQKISNSITSQIQKVIDEVAQ